MWAPDGVPGLEHARVTWHTEGVRADGVMIRRHASRTVRVRYAVHCDAQWCVREVRVAVLEPDELRLRLQADGQGRWLDHDGQPLSFLAGCLDVDLWAVAFTNTLPIRRLGLPPGASAEVDVAYIALPTLEVTRARQRYTCLENGPDRGPVSVRGAAQRVHRRAHGRCAGAGGRLPTTGTSRVVGIRQESKKVASAKNRDRLILTRTRRRRLSWAGISAFRASSHCSIG